MKKLYPRIVLTLSLITLFFSTINAQNVFDVNDKDSIFGAVKPALPGWGQINKWGHAVRLTNWGGTGTTSYKSYYYDQMPFRLKFPKSYAQGVADGKTYPIYIFFHGAGESGNAYDNEYQMFWGGQTWRDNVDNGKFDGFVFYDQSTNGYHTSYFAAITNILDSLAKYCKLDINRVIVNGLSSGGQSVWDFIGAYPKYIATALPISAARSDYFPTIPNYLQIPLWLFNGGLDNNPAPADAQRLVDSITRVGGNIKHTLYPNLGHGVWTNAWADPGFIPFMQAAYKSNPLVYFQKTNFCTGTTISAKLGLTSGYFAYQWMKDGVVIGGAASNTITVTQLGTYSARFQRLNGGAWSDWSHTPAVLTSNAVSATPNIAIKGLASNVLPAPDGSTTVPLFEPDGFNSYVWTRVSDNTTVGTASLYNAPAGTYTATTAALNSCSSTPSIPFTVAGANGPNKPDPASNLTAIAASQTSIQLNWSKNPHPTVSETGFEVYRASKSGGPYQLIVIRPTDSLNFIDQGLISNTTYYYIVRAVDATAAAANTNETFAKTFLDNVPPTAPSGLNVTSSSGNSISIAWQPSTDNVGVVSYDIYIDNQKAYNVPATQNSATIYNLNHDQTYNLQLKAKDAAGNVSPFSNAVTGAAIYKGLTYQYYQGAWTTLPNFNTLTPIATGAASNVNLNPATDITNFALVWQGYINIRKAGSYTFETNSDDGSKLYIGTTAYDPSATALVNNDGAHGAQSKTGTITLAVGYYPITVTYFQGGGGYNMSVYWTSTANGIARALIPDSAFVESFTSPGSAPAAPSNMTATPVAYNKVNLTWTDNSTTETGFEVYRAVSSSGPFTTITTTGPAVVSYIDTTVSPATTYYYKVRAINNFGQSAFDATGLGTQYAWYLTGSTLSALPNFTNMIPSGTGLWPNFSLGMQGAVTTNFAVKFDSYLKITTAGTYTFTTNSDDGSALYINGTQVVNNDGAHGAQDRTGTMSLAIGTYPITVTYYQGTGGFSLTASYSGPGLAKTQIPTSVLGKAFATTTTPALPPAPLAAFGLSGTALSSSAVNITWSDNSNDASSFQIYRSSVTNTSYRIIATVQNGGGATFNYTDAGLFDNVLYYYKIYAVGVGGTSPASNEASVQTLINNPVIAPIQNFTMRYGTQNTVSISVTKPGGSTVALSSVNLPSFGSFTDFGDGTGRIVFSPAITDQNVYNNIVVVATASNGGIAKDTFNMVVNSNNPPVMTTIASQTFDEGTKDTLNLSTIDPDGNTGLIYSISNAPSFVKLIDNGNGAGLLALAPSYISHGTYTITVTATDPQGGTSVKTFLLTINKKNPNEQYLVRIQYTAAVAAPWNNMTSASISNLTNAISGQATSVAVNFSPSSWWGTYNQGPVTGNNSGVYPDAVEKDYYYFGFNGGPNTVTNTISGLKPGLNYTFKFYAGSASPIVSNAGTTVYTIGSQSSSVYVQNNTQNVARIDNVIPDASGNVVVVMSKANDGITPAGFLNAMEINYNYDDLTAPALPTGLAASQTTGGPVNLTWTDVAYNAKQYLVYRGTDTTGAFTLLNPTANDPNAAAYADSTANGHTLYYYKLKVVNQYGDLGFTSPVGITTAAKNPIVSAIANTSVKANTTGNIAFTAKGDVGTTLSVTAVLPSFALLQNLGNGSFNIQINPTSNNTGVYNASVTAVDNYGSTITNSFQIAVVESNVNSVFIQFGTDTSAAPLPWNNLLGYPFANTSVSNLKRADGSNSGITLTLLDQWSNATNDYGMVTGDNSGLFPDIVMRSSLIETTTTPRRIKLSGLDATKFYNIVLFSSANNGQKGTSTFKIGTQTLNLEAAYNTNKTVQFNGQQADASGSIILTYSKDAASFYGYLNAMIIQSYDTNIVKIVSPNFVYAEPVHTSKNSLKIGWADRSYNETGIEVWRSTALNGTYSLVTTLPAGTVSYTDASLSANTQYFYKIRAVNSTVQSDYSTVAYATTPNSIILEHLTWHYLEGLRPWNNTGVNAQVGDVYSNLKNDQWNNSGVSLSVVDGPFEGETNTGLVSGNNSYIFPDTVMMGSFFVQLGQAPAKIKFGNLDQTKKYRLGFEGSTNVNVDMTGTMTINGLTKYLNAYSNTAKVVYFDGIAPDQNGEINMTFAAKGQYGVLGALVLMAYTDYGNTNMGTTSGSGSNIATVEAARFTPAPEVPAIDSAALQHFVAYPNPFRSSFTLGFNNIFGTKKIEIEVYNLSGQIIYRKDEDQIQAGSNSFQVNLPSVLPTGIYIAVIKSESKILKIFKVLKDK